MRYSDNEMCTILLSSYIGLTDDRVKPLSLGEWNGFVDTLIENKLEPSIAYTDGVTELRNYGYNDEFIERIKILVSRGASVAFELDEYEKKGISVTTFLDKEYPILLRRQLKNKKPPVLFYSGNLSLANKMGIGVVGARNISEQGIGFTKNLVEKAVEEKLVIYSGGAKGVDITSQTVALNKGGAVVAYLADALADRIKKKDVIDAISNGRLLLMSDSKPDVGFSAGRAMTRNKYIYASSMGTFVVESDYNKGGTWTGATEAMKNGWGKVFVWANKVEGNQKLIEAGAASFEITENKLVDVIASTSNDLNKPKDEYKQMSLFDLNS